METKRKIVLAAEMLRNSYGYVHGENSGTVSFDFTIDEDGESIEIFNSDHTFGTFFWPEKVVEIAQPLGLSCFVTTHYHSDDDGKSYKAIVMIVS
jgi:hypothetical protein